MRITGGQFGGRTLKVPRTADVRPTQDAVRQALFNMIGCEIPGATFLDLFAGSGSVGLEALSRGAVSATFVEADRRHFAVLSENVRALAVAAGTCVCADAYRWIDRYAGGGFSVVFADPPYALGEERGYAGVLATLAARGVVRPDGLFVAEMTAAQTVAETPGWDVLRDRVYGKTRLIVWRREPDKGKEGR